MTPNQVELIIKKLAVLGQVPKLDGDRITFSNSAVRRFINDANEVERCKRNRKLGASQKYNPAYFGIGFKEAASTLLQDDFDLYEFLFDICDEMDLLASKYVQSAEQAIVLICHSSFGTELETHIHQSCDSSKKTVTLFKRLTSHSKNPIMRMFEPVLEGSKIFERGYTSRKLMTLHARNTFATRTEFEIGESILMFDAQFIPHSMSFTDDIWLAFVYDGAVLKIPFEPNNQIGNLGYAIYPYNGG